MRRAFPSLLVLASLFVFTACPAKSPEEQVAEQRAKFRVVLNSWFVKAPAPVVDETMPAEGDETGDAAGEGTAEPGAAEPAADAGEPAASDAGVDVAAGTAPEAKIISFDLLVLYDGSGQPLPGITVVVTHAGADGKEKESWLHYLDTADIKKGAGKQMSFERDGVIFEEGDQFAVTLEASVAPEDRAQYQEFSSAP